MRKGIKLALALLFVVLIISACGSKEQGAGNKEATEGAPKKELYFINPKSIGYAYWDMAKKGAMQAGDDLGVEVIFNGHTEVDSAKQISMIEDMLIRNVTGIAVAPNDSKAVGSVFSKAKANGVKVVTFDSDAPETDRQYYIASGSDLEMSDTLIDIIAEDIGGEGEIAFMVAGLGAENQIAKMEAAKAKLAKDYPNIQIVSTVSSNDEMQVSLANAQNLIKTYPNLKGIVGFAGGEAPSAAEAVEQAVASGELKAGQVKITGIGWPNMNRKYIKNGTITKTVAWESEKLGYASVHVLHMLSHNKSIGNEIETKMGTFKVDGANVFTGILVIDKDNVDNYDF